MAQEAAKEQMLMAKSGNQASSVAKKTNFRWVICFFMWSAIAINYIDRASLSAATPILMKEFNISPADFGLVMSAFFWAYALLQIPAGHFADKFGQRITYTVSVAWWSVAQMCVAFASTLSGFIGARIFLGIGESGAYPCNAGVTAKWFPVHERARVSAIFDSAAKFGSAFAMPVIVWMIATFSWHAPFIVFGLVGVVWAIFFWKYYNDPHKSKHINKEELHYITEGKKVDYDEKSTVKWYQLLKYRNVQAMCIGFFILNYINYFFITWMPAYLMSDRGFSFEMMGIVAAIPAIIGICGELSGGVVSDKLYKMGFSLTKSRKAVLIIGMILASSIGLVAVFESDIVAIVLLSVASFGCVFAAPAVWSLPGDTVEKHTVSKLAGLQNCVSNMGGAVGSLITGIILGATNSFSAALFFSGGLALVAVLVYAFYLGPVRKIDLSK